MTVSDLYIVNYCHKSCQPLLNIMRLPKAQAFEMARNMAMSNKGVTAFYRFADFENYYPARLKTDELLYTRFVELGGKPKQKHPLSFVLQGSDFLDRWFDGGTVTKIPLESIDEDCVSFTYGDSMTVLERHGKFDMLTKRMLIKAISEYSGTLDEFLADISERYKYIEVQFWGDSFENE